ncbi:MAG: hypothetical protein WA003_04370 [Desulfuromonadaceae bacterium]
MRGQQTELPRSISRAWPMAARVASSSATFVGTSALESACHRLCGNKAGGAGQGGADSLHLLRQGLGPR